MTLKKIKQVLTAGPYHMVGDGFRVSNYIDPSLRNELNPFLVLDYNEPWQLLPTLHPRGVGVHPHKGFETVTIVWEGMLAHKDSSGGQGTLAPGDVQWMTAGSGILHSEFHAQDFSTKGGTLHMAQLWINLPAKYKNTPPAYQELRREMIAQYSLPQNKGTVRVIAGEFGGIKGPARTYTRLQLWDVNLQADGELNFSVPEGDVLAVAVLQGNLLCNHEQQVRGGSLLVFSRHHTDVNIVSNNDAQLLVLSGEPITEPMVAYGPFVMNSRQEILEAVEDYNAGKFGMLG